MGSEIQKENRTGHPHGWLRRLGWEGVVLLVLGGALLFGSLGWYAPWDDEAIQALTARSVLETGDTGAVVGENAVLYRDGLLLKGMKDRATAPLPAFYLAGWMAVLGQSFWAIRLPFVLCGVMFLGLVAWFAPYPGGDRRLRIILVVALLGNVSLFLFFRQCRYYAMAVLLVPLIYWLWVGRDGSWRRMGWIGILLGVLFASNYMAWGALCCCLAADFLLWGWRERRPHWKEVAAAAVPQALVIALVFPVWNPFITGIQGDVAQNSLVDRLGLFWLHLRDMNACEFGSLLVLVAAPLVAWWRGNRWPVRLALFILVYAAAIALVSPQPFSFKLHADVRYLAPVIPVYAALSAVVLWLVLPCKGRGASPWVALGLAVLLFGQNLIYGGPWAAGGWRSTPVLFAGELMSRPKHSFREAGEWAKENVKPGETVWAVPDYCVYPLMYQAPEAHWAWQLTAEKRERFPELAPFHFQGLEPPDWVILFGPVRQQVEPMMVQWRESGVHYALVEKLDVLWKDLYRPELSWRLFEELEGFNPESEGIYVYRRQ